MLEAKGRPRKDIRDQLELARANTKEALERLRKTLLADDDIVLQTQRRLAGLYRKLDQVAAARTEAEEALKLYQTRHPREEEDIVGRGFLLQALMEIIPEMASGICASLARIFCVRGRLSSAGQATQADCRRLLSSSDDIRHSVEKFGRTVVLWSTISPTGGEYRLVAHVDSSSADDVPPV